ncbi:MAG: ATP synthase F1 subunit delta [Nitrospirae bacterium]|nr:MAG: ATP synthase F1 subunit delta [Nitrospirota bacterium]
MKQIKEGKRYAKTFLNIVGIENAPSAINELNMVNALMTQSREFRGLLAGPQFTAGEKEKIIREVAGKIGLSDNTVRFVIYLSELRVIIALPEIIKIATNLYLEKKRRAKAVVMASAEISKEYENRLKAALEKVINKAIDIEVVKDPSLLGGILVKVGSTMYDSSIKGQLRLLKDELIKG